MERQSHPLDQWIVVDDGPTTMPLTLQQTLIRPQPLWSGENTQRRNLLAALNALETDFILIIEDDDWYSPDYVAGMVSQLEDHGVVGEVVRFGEADQLNRCGDAPNAHKVDTQIAWATSSGFVSAFKMSTS